LSKQKNHLTKSGLSLKINLFNQQSIFILKNLPSQHQTQFTEVEMDALSTIQMDLLVSHARMLKLRLIIQSIIQFQILALIKISKILNNTRQMLKEN